MDWVDLEIVPQHATTETVLAAAHAVQGTQRRKDKSDDDRSRMRNLELRLLVLALVGVALTLLVPA